MPISVDSTIERGTVRSGSLTSLPTYVISIQPSYAHNAATIATPNGAIQLPTDVPAEAGGQSGDKFATLPPGSTNPATIKTTSRAILTRVSTFWVIAPSLTPRQFSAVSATMEATATALMPAPASGTKKPQ